MLVSFKNISLSFDFIFKQTSNKITSLIFDYSPTNYKLPPISVGDTVLQIKKTGSAMFKTPNGDVLVQITKKGNGLYHFKATKEGVKPVIFIESKRHMGGAIWEVKVSNYLKELISRSTDINYIAKTKKWDWLNRFSVGYLYFSGYVLNDLQPSQKIFHASISSNLALIPSFVSLISQAHGLTTQEPLSLLYSLPDISVEPNIKLNHNIVLRSYCQSTNPNENIELSIQQANGEPLPHWISMGMGAITLESTKYTLKPGSGSIVVSGNYAYILTYITQYFLYIVDISDSKNPILRGSLLSSTNSQDITIKDNYAYLLDSNYLKVVDISNPSNPTLVKSIWGSFSQTHQFIKNKDFLYILNTNNIGKTNLTTFHIENPSNPVLLNTLTLGNYNLGSASISIIGNYAVAITINCYFLDITNPSTPVLVHTLESIGGSSSLAYKNRLFIGSNNKLSVYDITSVDNPKKVDELYLYYYVGLLIAKGNYIYVSPCNNEVASCYSSEMTIIDVTDVQNLKIVANFPTLGSPSQAALSGNRLCIANGDAGLAIFDAGSRVLSGTPSPSDRGLLLLNVTVQNDAGDSLIDQIAIHVGDISIAIPIENQQVFVGNSTILSLPAGTFEFPNANFTYSAALVGESPLPPFINFDSETRTFQFTPKSGDQNTYRIQVTGDTGYSKTISTTFELLIPNQPPLLEQPLTNQTAYTNTFFDYSVSRNSFTDKDNDPLDFSAYLAGSTVLPDWLNFDPASLRFYGTAIGRNTYQIQMKADDNNGGNVLGTFSINVPNSAPFLENPIGTQLATPGIPFSYPLYSDTFYDFDNDPLTYSTSKLPTFLQFNPSTITFKGTPKAQDSGVISIDIYAEDPFGAKATADFTLTVLTSSSGDLPPMVIVQIPDMSVITGIPFNTTFNKGTFNDPQYLTYTATLEGGAPLPEGLYFDAGAFSLSGVVNTPQTWRISIQATDPSGLYAIDTFVFAATDGTKYPPIVLNPLPDELATVGSPFFYQIPPSTFKELSEDPLTITVIQSGGLPLPKWLKWDLNTLSFSGTPGPFDTNTYATREHTIDVWAEDSGGSVKASFKIIVNGESFFAKFIKYGFSFASVVGSGMGIWKSRAMIWNYFSKHEKETQKAFVNEPYTYMLTIPYKNLKEIRAYRSGKVLPQRQYLPKGLFYKGNQLQGTPSPESVGLYTIYITDHKGYINKKFDLIIKNNENDPDPEKPLSLISKLYSSFKRKEDEEMLELNKE